MVREELFIPGLEDGGKKTQDERCRQTPELEKAKRQIHTWRLQRD